MSCAAIVLAAGESRRLGEAKQLVELGGERLVERAVRVAAEAGCDPVVVVLGAHADEIRAAALLGVARVVLNEGWREGIASSIRAGVLAANESLEVQGFLVMTCDQPTVDAVHLLRLKREGEAGTVRVSSRYAGRCGVPAYFPVADVEELLSLRGDAGARSLLQGSKTVELADGALDVDTRESLEAARLRFNAG